MQWYFSYCKWNDRYCSIIFKIYIYTLSVYVYFLYNTIYIEGKNNICEEYSASETYIPREERPEWAIVGFVGKLLVYHDGTIKPGNKCKPNDDGIATLSTDGTGYYVMSIDDDVAKILLK